MWRISSPNMWLSKWILDRKNSPRHSSGLPMVFTIIWSIWFHRSQVTYEGKTLNAHETLLTSTTLIDRYNKAYADAQMEQSPKRNTTLPPPPPPPSLSLSLSLSLSRTRLRKLQILLIPDIAWRKEERWSRKASVGISKGGKNCRLTRH